MVVHEIVEIDEIKKMGLDIGRKDVIVSNMELVDVAHLKAARIEMKIAYAMKNRAHLAESVQYILRWSKDALVEPGMRKRYAELRQEVLRMLIQLDKK